MLQYQHAPSADRLGVFLKLLGDLRSFRVQAKALARELKGAERRNAERLWPRPLVAGSRACFSHDFFRGRDTM